MNRADKILSSGVVLIALAVSACGREKSEALDAVEKMKAACGAGERQKAQDIMLTTAEKNETFSKSFRNVTGNVPDKTVIDACGTIGDRVKKHIEEQ